MTTPAPLLLWTDEETAGIEDDDATLEVAFILTDNHLHELGSIVALVRPSERTFERIAEQPVVQHLHESSGLLGELKTAEPEELTSVAELERMVMALIEARATPDQTIYMAGGGVSHFDRRHLGKQMPLLDARLHYGTVDVSDIIRGFEAATLNKTAFKKPGEKPHRAMGDLRQELHLASRIWDMFEQHAAMQGIENWSDPTDSTDRVMMGASILQAAVGVDDEKLELFLGATEPRRAIAGLAAIGVELLRMVSDRDGVSPEQTLDALRLHAIG